MTTVRPPLRLLSPGLAAALLLAAPSAALGVERSFDIDFQLTDVPLFDPDQTAPTFEAVLGSVPVGPSLNLGSIADVPVFGEFGLEASFFAGVNINLLTKVQDFSLGTATVDFPVRVKLDTPAAIQPGQEFTIGSSYEILPGAGFQAQGNQAVLDIGAQVELAAELSLKACAFGCFIDEKPLDASHPLGTIPLVKQTVNSTEFQIDIPGYGKPTIAGPGVDIDPDNTDDSRSVTDPDFLLDFAIANATNVDGKIQAPKLDLQGNLVGNTLVGTGRDAFTEVNVNLAGFIPGTTLANLGPIDLGHGLQFGYDLFSGVLSTQMFQEQRLEFKGIPQITLDLGPELGTHTFDAGDSLTLVAPADPGSLVFDPEITLSSMLMADIDLAATQDFTVTVGGLFLKMPDIVVVEPTSPVIVDPPRFCLIPGFRGCIKYVDPPAFTLVPGTKGITIPGFSFDEQILRYSYRDAYLDTPLPPPVGATAGGIDGVEKSESFASMQTFQSAAFNTGPIRVQVPVPPAMALLLVPGLLLAVRRRRPA